MRKVYFFSGMHPIQESIIKSPPPGYEVISNVSSKDFETIREYSTKYSILKMGASKVYNLLDLPRLIYINRNCDIIHTTSGVIPLNKKPFVVSAEYYSSFVGLQHERALKNSTQKRVKRFLSSDSCRKILPFSNASRRSIINAFNPEPKDFLDKIEVLYPAITPKEYKRTFGKEKIKILHIGNGFFEKGGRELFEAISILNKDYKYDVELCSITGAPVHYMKEFLNFISKYKHNLNYKIITETMPRKTLFDYYYNNYDIFVLPSYGDLFGYVFLEAMSTGMPLIGTDVFAIPEIIENGKNGFLVKCPISPFESNYIRKSNDAVKTYLKEIVHSKFPDVVYELVEKLQVLIEKPNLREKMSNNGYKAIKDGKFSIINRNNQLRRIYDEALTNRV